MEAPSTSLIGDSCYCTAVACAFSTANCQSSEETLAPAPFLSSSGYASIGLPCCTHALFGSDLFSRHDSSAITS